MENNETAEGSGLARPPCSAFAVIKRSRTGGNCVYAQPISYFFRKKDADSEAARLGSLPDDVDEWTYGFSHIVEEIFILSPNVEVTGDPLEAPHGSGMFVV